ncbi:hypothetical protein D9M72_583410 [compost metagenome]
MNLEDLDFRDCGINRVLALGNHCTKRQHRHFSSHIAIGVEGLLQIGSIAIQMTGIDKIPAGMCGKQRAFRACT